MMLSRPQPRAAVLPGWALAILMLFCGPAAIGAGPSAETPIAWLPAASSPRQEGSSARAGHAWLVVPGVVTPGSPRSFSLLNVPPRSAGAVAGFLARSATLGAQPEALAAWGDEVFMVFPPQATPQGGVIRRVARMLALKTVADTWVYYPDAGPEARPSLSGDGLILGAAGTSVGPLVLRRTDEGVVGEVLRPGGWTTVGLPEAVARAALDALVWLACEASGPTLVLQSPGASHAEVFRAVLALSRDDAGERISGTWGAGVPLPPLVRGSEGMAGGGGGAGPEARDSGTLLTVDGQLVLAQASLSGVRLRLVRESGSAVLADVPCVGPLRAVAALDGLGRVLLAHADDGPAPARAPRSPPDSPGAGVRLWEVSAYTGRVLFEGTGGGKLLAPWQMQAIMVVVGGVMIAVLLFVLRSESSTPVVLPPGFALASPAKRLVAALIDLAIIVGAAAVLTRATPAELFAPALLKGSARAMLPVLGVLAAGLVYSTVLESVWGRTLGKRVLGLRVFGVREATAGEAQDPGSSSSRRRGDYRVGDVVVGTPRLLPSLLRNAVRWAVPPLTVLVLLDANWRHPGDVMAGSVVAEPADDDAADRAESSDEP